MGRGLVMGPKCLRCGFDAEGFKVGRAGEDFGVPCLPGEHRWPERRVAEQTVREQLAEVLKGAESCVRQGAYLNQQWLMEAQAALARHRAEPEQRECVR